MHWRCAGLAIVGCGARGAVLPGETLERRTLWVNAQRYPRGVQLLRYELVHLFCNHKSEIQVSKFRNIEQTQRTFFPNFNKSACNHFMKSYWKCINKLSRDLSISPRDQKHKQFFLCMRLILYCVNIHVLIHKT